MQTKCPRWCAALSFVVLFIGAGFGQAFGTVDRPVSPSSSASASSSPLPYPKALQPRVEFWTNIFGTYSEYQVVIHDAVYLDKVYDVLDFRPLLKKHSEAKVRKLKAKRTKQELKKIRAALRKLHKHGAKGRTLSSRERKIRSLFKDVKERHKFRKATARSRLRAQSGIRERFQEGLRISGRYLPRMEKIFRQKGLPVVLTRLPLIESSFNIEAHSKVGATGIWQFMPATGRLFLTINHVVDERLDPLIATRAAADLLKSNYDKLQTWPLAVTAYNHGPAGMARAVRKVGTRDIATIIRRYKSRTFGFASRNFYAELLAAIAVEKNSEKYFGPFKRDPLLWYDEVKLKHFVSLKNLAITANTSTQRLLALNPSFGRLIRNGRLHVPRGHRLRIPAGASEHFSRQYAALSPRAKADRQLVAFASHKVRRGQTLGGIAQRYGTSIRTLKRLNGLKSVNLIRIGQRLRVPVRGQGRQPAARFVRLAQDAPREVTHTVRPGESLGRIARRYKTTIASLQQLNGIKNAALIPVGKKLRVSANSQNSGGTAKPKAKYIRHTVRQGQTLGRIARRYKTTIASLQQLNGIKNAALIPVGKKLRVSANSQNSGGTAKPKAKYIRHTVRQGQTLGSIARRYGTKVSVLKRLNGVKNVKRLQIGQVLRIPKG